MAHKIKRKKISLAVQKLNLNHRFPSWETKIDRETLICTGTLQPTDASVVYTISIVYKYQKRKKDDRSIDVFILSPESLKNSRGEDPPHIYSDGTLCLFRPLKNEWNQSMLISDTIIPWTSLWLYYYEIWLTTGKWMGGGEHPS